MPGFTAARCQGTFGKHQIQRSHAGEVHADDASAENQRRAVLEQLMRDAAAFAEIARHPQRGETGADGNQHRQREQPRLVVGGGARPHRGHADVMHASDAQTDDTCGLEAMQRARLHLTESVHGQPRGEQGDQQRQEGNAEVVLNIDGGLEGQHADEVHGPDAAGQAGRADPAPDSPRPRIFGMHQALCHVQGGEARRAGDQIGHHHQQRVVAAIEENLPARRQLGNKLQTKPLHSMPRLGFIWPVRQSTQANESSIEAVFRLQAVVAYWW